MPNQFVPMTATDPYAIQDFRSRRAQALAETLEAQAYRPGPAIQLADPNNTGKSTASGMVVGKNAAMLGLGLKGRPIIGQSNQPIGLTQPLDELQGKDRSTPVTEDDNTMLNPPPAFTPDVIPAAYRDEPTEQPLPFQGYTVPTDASLSPSGLTDQRTRQLQLMKALEELIQSRRES